MHNTRDPASSSGSVMGSLGSGEVVPASGIVDVVDLLDDGDLGTERRTVVGDTVVVEVAGSDRSGLRLGGVELGGRTGTDRDAAVAALAELGGLPTAAR